MKICDEAVSHRLGEHAEAGTHEGQEEPFLDKVELRGDEPRPALAGGELWDRETAAHGEAGYRDDKRRPHRPYSQRPARPDLFEEHVEDEWEDET